MRADDWMSKIRRLCSHGYSASFQGRDCDRTDANLQQWRERYRRGGSFQWLIPGGASMPGAAAGGAAVILVSPPSRRVSAEACQAPGDTPSVITITRKIGVRLGR